MTMEASTTYFESDTAFDIISSHLSNSNEVHTHARARTSRHHGCLFTHHKQLWKSARFKHAIEESTVMLHIKLNRCLQPPPPPSLPSLPLCRSPPHTCEPDLVPFDCASIGCAARSSFWSFCESPCRVRIRTTSTTCGERDQSLARPGTQATPSTVKSTTPL